MAKISILVAAYNIENYISDCMQSILNQTDLSDVEVVVIDNNSQDNTSKIIDDFANNYPLIKVFHLDENIGLFLSRHFAIEHSTGEYLIFLDGDDKLTNNAIESLKNDIKTFTPDMVIYRCKEFGDSDKVHENVLGYRQPSLCTLKDVIKLKYIFSSSEELNNIWIKLVKRELFDTFTDYHQYKDYRYAEDRLNSIYLFANSRKIVYDPSLLYEYRIRNTSISAVLRFDRFYQHHTINKILFSNLINETDFSKDQLRQIGCNRKYTEMRTMMKCVSKNDIKDKDILMKLKEISKYYNELDLYKTANAGILFNLQYKKVCKQKYRFVCFLNKLYKILKHGRN